MKKMIFSLLAILFVSIPADAMSISKAREEARFLTDKMAYELDLTDDQLEDIYEINYDYFRSLDAVSSEFDPMFDRRYRDIEYVLYDWQWRAFVACDYFLHPMRLVNGLWHLTAYNYYRPTHFYYAQPRCYHTYHGGRAHTYYSTRRNVYRQPHYAPVYSHRKGVVPTHHASTHIERGPMNRGDRAVRERGGAVRDDRNSAVRTDRGTKDRTERGNTSRIDRNSTTKADSRENSRNDRRR